MNNLFLLMFVIASERLESVSGVSYPLEQILLLFFFFFYHKAVKQEVDKLQEENKRLANNVEDLTTSVQHLDDVQQALDVITKTQGQSIDEFSQQVQQNKKILKQMKSNLKASILQNLLSVVLRSDTDRDFVISEGETDDLVRRLNNIAGVQLYESRFRTAITGQSITAVMDIVKNLLKDDVPDDEIIFVLEKQQQKQ